MTLQFVSAEPAWAEIYLQYRQDSVTQQFNPVIPSGLEEVRARLAEACSDWSQFSEKNAFFWFVTSAGAPVGCVSLSNANRMMLTADIGYGIFAGHRGKGFASEMVEAFTRTAFEQTNLRKLVAYVHEGNLASRRVMEKAGYVAEGLLREHYLVQGQPVNELVYGILRREAGVPVSKN